MLLNACLLMVQDKLQFGEIHFSHVLGHWAAQLMHCERQEARWPCWDIGHRSQLELGHFSTLVRWLVTAHGRSGISLIFNCLNKKISWILSKIPTALEATLRPSAFLLCPFGCLQYAKCSDCYGGKRSDAHFPGVTTVPSFPLTEDEGRVEMAHYRV